MKKSNIMNMKKNMENTMKNNNKKKNNMKKNNMKKNKKEGVKREEKNEEKKAVETSFLAQSKYYILGEYGNVIFCVIR